MNVSCSRYHREHQDFCGIQLCRPRNKRRNQPTRALRNRQKVGGRISPIRALSLEVSGYWDHHVRSWILLELTSNPILKSITNNYYSSGDVICSLLRDNTKVQSRNSGFLNDVAELSLRNLNNANQQILQVKIVFQKKENFRQLSLSEFNLSFIIEKLKI